MDKLPQNYDFQSTEKKLQQQWYENNIYSWESDLPREQTFVIDTPPPTVSGLLHMGHIFSYTQADFIARYQRMIGKTVFYPIGFDDNGLPTERLVEKVKNIRAVNMKRQEFIDICSEVVKESEEEFRKLFKSIALSVDWSLEYQTISKHSRTISQMSFLDLCDKDKAYRKLQPTLWDPIDQTALAQADIVDQEMAGTMNNIAFSTMDGEEIIIATTRPELIAACVAVFYHPDDKRYEHLKGKNAITALFKVKVPILPDETVDIEKGTGLVMCCTFGDITDIEWWKKHHLPTRVIIDKRGRLYNMEQLGNNDWPSLCKEEAQQVVAEINGLKVKEARGKMLELLAAAALLREQTEIKHSVKCAERSGAPLEIIVSPQWFIKVLDIKDRLLERSSECNWHPSYMKIRLDNWINGLNWDWCISRQRFFGVPFPAWYSKRPGEEGKILLAHPADLPVDPLVDLPRGYSKEEVEPDMDVMDTWATSSVSPQLSSHAINQKYAVNYQRHQKLFPADLRPQAHEIIRTWAFYSIVKAELHEQQIPWKNLMISGWCLASDKSKMSKSKGNVITPVHLIEEKGSDVVRYWASTSRLGADTAYSEDVLKIGRKLVNKIWNAAKFASIHIEKITEKPLSVKEQINQGVIFATIDLWVLSRLKNAIIKSSAEFDKFEYCNARVIIEDFFWNDFCDNYLELVKVRAYDEEGKDAKAQQSAINTIYHCVETLLRLFAPILPHITEEIYANIFSNHLAKGGSIHQRGYWPNINDFTLDAGSEESGQACVSILNVIRKVKAEGNLSLKTPLTKVKIFPVATVASARDIVTKVLGDLKNVSNASEIVFEDMGDSGIETEDGKFKVYVII
jgi:valyl-tRNA synthetase